MMVILIVIIVVLLLGGGGIHYGQWGGPGYSRYGTGGLSLGGLLLVVLIIALVLGYF